MNTYPQFDYSAEIYSATNGSRYGRRLIPTAQLEPARSQILFLGQRRGKIPADTSGIRVVDTPVFEPDSHDQISGITLTAEHAGKRVHQVFALDVFDSVITRSLSDLIESKKVAPDHKLGFHIFANTAEPAAPAGEQPKIKTQPLPLLPGSIRELRAEAAVSGPVDDQDHPVFVMESALEQAQSQSWKGRTKEGGAWLVGNLFQQIEPFPEIFAVIHTAIEAIGATHDRFSLDLTAESYQHINAQMDLRKRRFQKNGELVTAFYHTHPFLPSILDGKEACPECPLRPTCTLSSSFFSAMDARFHTSFFGRSAFAVELVMGLTPREEFDLRMFCMDGGKFRQRGFYRLPRLPSSFSFQL